MPIGYQALLREKGNMLRKSVVILTMLLCGVATQVYALGLGSVSVESALNQPLRVRIELLQLGNTRIQDVTVVMAALDDFQRFNIERVGFLSNIRFNIEATTQGTFIILSSNQIVREPYLSFILDTRWPSGRLLSEHTVLLDLPVFDDRQATPSVRQPISPVLQSPAVTQPRQPFVEPAVPDVAPPVLVPIIPPTEVIDSPRADEAAQVDQAAPVTETLEETSPDPATTEPVVEEEQLTEPEPTILVAEPPEQQAVDDEQVPPTEEEEPQVAVAAIVDEALEVAVDASVEPDAVDIPETIETTATDTLSDIALRVRPDNSVSMQQTMLAIQQLNPDAFVDGNINNLRSGQVLRIPSLAEIQSLDPRAAVSEIARQNQQLADADVEPLAAPADATPAQEDLQQGQLSVVTDDIDAIDASSGAGQEADAANAELDRRITELEIQLALGQEEADRGRIEREEINSRLAELDSQIAAAQEIIRLQDLQLAQLQDSLAQAAAAARQEAVLAAAQVEIEQPIGGTSTSLLDDILRIFTGNTALLILGGVLVISLLVGLLIWRNRAAKAADGELDELAEQEFDAAADETDAVAGSESEVASTELEDKDIESSDLDSELDDILAVDEDLDEQKAAEVDESAADLIARVAVFIGQNQLVQAVSLLNPALEKQPGNDELRLKLLEVFAEKGDLAAFEEQADLLAASNDPTIELKTQALRKKFEDAAADEEVQQRSDTASFLDDLGIDLDAFDDVEEDAFESTADAETDAAVDEEIEESVSVASFDEEMDLTFDLGGDDESPESAVEAEEQEQEEEEEQAPEEEPEKEVTSDEDAVDYAADDSADALVAGASKDADELQIDTLEFDEAGAADELEPEADEEKEEIDMETYSFDADDLKVESDAALDAAEEESTAEDDAMDSVEFDFDKEEIKADSPAKLEEDLETFEFDLEDSAESTLVEKPKVGEEADSTGVAIDYADAEIDDAEVADTEIDLAKPSEEDAETTADSEFDIDLDEFEIDAKATDSDEEIDLDDSVVVEATKSADDDDDLDLEAAKTADAAADSGADEVELEIDMDADIDLEGIDDADDAAASAESEDELEDLEFLSEDDEVEIESVEDIEEVGLLSDDDESATKLELAYAYHKMGDAEGAKEILQEVIEEGTDAQVEEARRLLSTLEQPAD